MKSYNCVSGILVSGILEPYNCASYFLIIVT